MVHILQILVGLVRPDFYSAGAQLDEIKMQTGISGLLYCQIVAWLDKPLLSQPILPAGRSADIPHLASQAASDCDFSFSIKQLLACISQCASTARFTSGGRIHPGSCR